MLINYSKLIEPLHLNHRIIIINCPLECYPLLQSSLQIVSEQIADSWETHQYNIDKSFAIEQVLLEMNNTSLFNDGDYYQLNFTVKPSVSQIEIIKKIIQALDKHNFVSICLSLDYKDIKAAWISDVSKHGYFLNITDNSHDINQFVEHSLSSNQLTITPEAKSELINLNRSNLMQLAQSINNLCNLFSSQYQITVEDIKTHIMDNSQYSIYNIASLLLNGNINEAYKILTEIIQETDNLILLLWNLNDDLKKLIKLKSLSRTNSNISGAMQTLRIYGDKVSVFNKAFNRIKYQEMLAIQDHLANIDMIIKGVIDTSIEEEFLRLVMQYK